MKHYTVYHEFDSDDCLVWHVYEKATDQIIATHWFEEDAMEQALSLDKGMGFFGFTPSFILRKVSVDKNINEAFSAEFA